MSSSNLPNDTGEEAWERQAATWSERVRAGEDIYRDAFNRPAFLGFLPDVAGLTVIDLGCGEGGMTRDLALRGAHMTGIDRSETMISHAKAHEAREPLGIGYTVGDLRHLEGIEDESFDFAISTMAIMNCPDLPAVMAAAARVLKPGGALSFSVLHPCFVTPGFGWMAGDSGDALTVAGYFAEGPVMEHLDFGKTEYEDSAIEVPRFPHRLEHYVSALAAAGFQITALVEPRPTEAAAAKHPRLARWRREAALFIYFAARKAESVPLR